MTDKPQANPDYVTGISEYLSATEGINTSTHNPILGSSSEVITDLSVRSPYGKDNYYSFRKGESIPSKFKDRVIACRHVYERVGIVRDVIDLLTDFVVDGFDINNPDPKASAFYKAWIRKCSVRDAVDEFARHFFIDCNTVVRRVTARLSTPVEEKEFVEAKPDRKVRIKDVAPYRTEKRVIPWQYVFLSPTHLEWAVENDGGVPKKQLYYVINDQFISSLNSLKNDKDPYYEAIIQSLPEEARAAVREGKPKIKLDMAKVYYAHNKKDSWQSWATPFLVSVLPDIYFKEKLRLADTAALDGVINVIRLWKLGDHTQKPKPFLPSSKVIKKLVNILESNVGGGVLDIVWDSMIEMKDFYPPTDKILGSEKYDQVNADILIGLGVPEVLIGGKGGNFSNSFIQLKTITQRLQRVRHALVNWLQTEVKIIDAAMGFSSPSIIRFNHANMGDENVTRQLMIQLVDRGILSTEALIKYFGEDWEMEKQRLQEQTEFYENETIERVGPYKHAVDPNEKQNGDSDGGPGRPNNTKDVGPRKRASEPKSIAHRRGASESESIAYRTRSPDSKSLASLPRAVGVVGEVFEFVEQSFMSERNIADKRLLTMPQRDEIFQKQILSISSFDLSFLNKKPNEIIETIQSPDPIQECVDLINHGISHFKREEAREPTKSEKVKICAAAWVEFIQMLDEDKGI
jgi:hypothetical protein